jgi:LmbE family N-acetylglucosaminyl deacetylase
LDAVSDPQRPVIDAGKIAVVVAHPDDETVGCGGLLPRLRGVSVVVITDGSPDDLSDAHAAGCYNREQYAARRARELDHALQIAGAPMVAVTRHGIRDQHAIFHLKKIATRLARHFVQQNIEIVLTHAYEGGHPDHDAAAFAVHRVARASPRKIEVIEMPYYRLGDHGEERQSFAWAKDYPPTTMILNDEESTRKQQMIEAHRTQAQVLAGFSADREQFRVAPGYDFLRPPNGGRLLYERRDWGIKSEEWLACVREVDGVP